MYDQLLAHQDALQLRDLVRRAEKLVNGRRYYGTYDLVTLSADLCAVRGQVVPTS